MPRDVEVPHAKREIDRVDIVEGWRQPERWATRNRGPREDSGDRRTRGAADEQATAEGASVPSAIFKQGAGGARR